MVNLRRRRGAFFGAFAAALLLSPVADASSEQPPPPALTLVDEALVDTLRSVLNNPIVTLSVERQTAARGRLSEREIERLDAQWRKETQDSRKPLIAATLANPLSSYLTRVQAHSLGLYCEIFVMDANGLNVGQSTITSDYWQGDEAKFQNTFPISADAVFVDEAQWHEESRTWRIQISLSLPAPEGGAAIGAATFEINLTELQRRSDG